MKFWGYLSGRLVLSVLCISFLSVPVYGMETNKSSIPISSLRYNDISFNKNIKKELLSLDNAIKIKDFKVIKNITERLKVIRLNLMSDNLPFVAEFMREKGNLLIASGEQDTGIFILERAREVFPFHYKIHFTLSKIYLSMATLDPNKAYLNLMTGLKAYLKLESRRAGLISYLILLLIAAYFISMYFYLFALLIRHFKRLYNDIKKTITVSYDWNFSGLLAFLVIISPFIAGGGFAFIVIIPVFIWPYLKSKNEKGILMFSAFLLLLIYPMTRSGTGILNNSDSYYQYKVENFSNQIWDIETLKIFTDRLQKTPNDYFLNTAVGLIYGWQDNMKKASAYFRKLDYEYPNNPDILINYGNIKLMSGKNKEAAKFYARAIKIFPDSLEAHYNLKIALENLLKFERAESEYKKAFSLNPAQVQSFLKIDNTGKTRPMYRLPNNESVKKITGSAFSFSKHQKKLWDLLLVPTNFKGLLFVFIIFIIMFYIFRHFANIGISKECDHCGSLFNKDSNCALCAALKLPTDRLDPKKRKEGFLKVQKYEWRVDIAHKFFNAVIPGTGAVLEENDISGFVTIFFNTFLILCITSNIFYVSSPIPTGILFILYGVYYFSNNLIFIKTR